MTLYIYRKRLFACILSFIILFITSCSKESAVPEELPGLNEKLNFTSSDYYSHLKDHFISSYSSTKEINRILKYGDTLKYFYAERNYQPVFIKSFENGEFLDSFLIFIAGAEEHGLDPETYHFSLIKYEFLSSIDKKPAADRYSHLVNTELLICDAVINYAYHLRYGVVNPKELYPDSYFLPVKDSLYRDIFEPLREENVLKYLNDIQPANPVYVKLQSALKTYKKMSGLEWEPIHFVKKLELGASDTSVYFIARRLEKLGLFSLNDSTKNYSDYDTLLLAAVKEFQRINGLKEDGVIGKATVDRFNVTPAEYADKIKINLERFRWIDYSNVNEYILVNIPEFKLHVMEKSEEKFNIVVCTGKRRSANYDKQYEIYKKSRNYRSRPDDWETPQMYGELSYMVLNPTWTVPVNIIREEIAGEVRKDSTYFQRKNFKVFKNGIRVDPSEIKAGALASAHVPYTIVQDPGAGNALGKIKFMFKNPFGIYLHDTPTRAPFSLPDRAVSHGCIRVEKPMMLSGFLLEHQSKWNLDYLKIEIGVKPDDPSSSAEYKKVRSDLRKNSSYGQTTEVKLEKKIPLYINYYTAWVDEEGKLNTRDDVYRKDKKLYDSLFPTTDINLASDK
jgi:L,D-transpeptidase YcbB